MSKRQGREQWVHAGWRALVRGGARAVRVEALAREIGVTKGSFYHHFPNRDALMDALLETWRAHGTEAIIVQADQELGPVARFRVLCDAIFESTDADAVEVAMRAWAATDDRVRELVAQVDARRVSYVEGLLGEAGLGERAAKHRAMLLYRAVIGDFMWRDAGGPKMTDQERDDLIALMMSEERDLKAV